MPDEIIEAKFTENELPFLVHMEGPDDIEEFVTWEGACVYAHEFNESVLAYNERTKSPGMVRSWAIPYKREDYEARWEAILGAAS